MFTRTKRTADRLAASLKKEGVRTRRPSTAIFPSECASERSTTSRTAVYPCSWPPTWRHAGSTSTTSRSSCTTTRRRTTRPTCTAPGRTARAGESGIVVTLVLWNEELEVKRLLPRIGVKQPLVEVFSNDPRLADLAAWDPSDTAEPATR